MFAKSIKLLLLAIAIVGCDTASQVSRRSMAAKSPDDKVADAKPQDVARDPAASSILNELPNTQLGWDGKSFGETKTFYVVPAE